MKLLIKLSGKAREVFTMIELWAKQNPNKTLAEVEHEVRN